MGIRSSDPVAKAALYYNMGNCYIRLKEFAKAREMFIKSLSLHYDREADENLAFIARAEEQDHMLTGRQEGKKRAQREQPGGRKEKRGGRFEPAERCRPLQRRRRQKDAGRRAYLLFRCKIEALIQTV